MVLHFIHELSKVFGDCAMGSAMFCPYAEKTGRSLRPGGRVPGLCSLADGRGAMFSDEKKRSKMKFEYAKA